MAQFQTDVMIDIETLGLPPDGIPVTIGVCEFSLDAEVTILNKFQIHVHAGTAQKAGMSMNANTLMWWMAQSKEAQASLISDKAISLTQALLKLSEYIAIVRAKNFKSRINIWANDPDFDTAILGAAYAAVGQTPPWQFYETRSCRTIQELGERLFGFNKKAECPRLGTHHAADDDAEYQAQVVKYLYERMKRVILP
jgi:hypothetical protein